ncbi:MAG: hypothetical protein M1826_006800 [Phylliscum demangeonii]|nr:MAG: hypothetical protein M1826_006800 [Phylliscum demangeonii]
MDIASDHEHEHEDDSISLQQLEPSPVYDPTSVAANNHDPDDIPFRGSSHSHSHDPVQPHSVPAHRPSHRTPYYLLRIQRYSSYLSTVFLTLHLTNTSLLPLITRSVPNAERYLLLTRPYYQSALTEPALVALPFAAHVLAGVGLRVYRRVQRSRRHGAETRSERAQLAWWPALSGTSMLGYAVTPLVLAHALVNRALPRWRHGDSASIGLAYVGHGFARAPWTSLALYGALVVGVSAHVVWGAAKWLAVTPATVVGGRLDAPSAEATRRRRRRGWALNAGAALLAAVWLAGGLGVVARAGPARGWVAAAYDDLLRHVPVIGRGL